MNEMLIYTHIHMHTCAYTEQYAGCICPSYLWLCTFFLFPVLCAIGLVRVIKGIHRLIEVLPHQVPLVLPSVTGEILDSFLIGGLGPSGECCAGLPGELPTGQFMQFMCPDSVVRWQREVVPPNLWCLTVARRWG